MNLYERVLSVLRASRVFGFLDESVLCDLARSFEFRKVHGGTLVLQQGDVPESMIFVISGVLRASRHEADGSYHMRNDIRSGQGIGEIGMILQQPCTVDVMALRDSSLAVLSRRSYETLVLRYPLALNRLFVQIICDVLDHSVHVKRGRYAQSFAVIALHPGAGCSEVVSSLVRVLSQRGRVHHFKPQFHAENMTSVMPLAFDPRHHDERDDQFDFLVYESDESLSSWTRYACRQADQIIFVASVGASPALGEMETLLVAKPGFAIKRRHLVLLHPCSAIKPQGVVQWRGLREFERIYPVRHQHQGDFARLARFLTGTAVGVVLGGGGARGFAHIGVLRALKESGIPVDLVGGNSMGALIGAQYVSGVPLDMILTNTQQFAVGGEHPTFPLISLVSGRRVERDLKRMFGDLTIDDLWLPFFAAACNLTKSVTAVQDSGPLWRAVLASNSPVGLFPPIPHQGDLLVDGAILNNVPVDAMRARLGPPREKRRSNGTLIAVDVSVPESIGVDPSLTRLTLWNTLKCYFSQNTQPMPGLASLVSCARHMSSANQRKLTMEQADHYLMPPVSAFSLMSYRRATDIAEVGYRYTMDHIQNWKFPPNYHDPHACPKEHGDQGDGDANLSIP